MNASVRGVEADGVTIENLRGQTAVKPSILVVDDEAPIHDLLRLYFENQGFAVETLLTGKECLAHLKQKPTDVVLLDINLGSEDGMDVLTEIKRMRPAPKVVMHTGMGYPEDLLNESLNRGADGYVAKGIPLEEVSRVIRRVLSVSESGRKA